MAETNKINAYANIKQQTGADLRLPPRQIVSDSYEADSVASQTVINLPFLVDLSNNKSFQLYVNGRILREGSSNDYTFTNIAADNTSSQVTLTQALIANLNIIAHKLGVDKEVINADNLKAELNRRKVYPNYILNGTFEYEEVLGWMLYNDSAATPVDGIGGTVNVNVTFATTTITALRGGKSALLSKDAVNRQGHGVSYDFSIDKADTNKALTIRMDVEGSSLYQSGRAKAYIYDKLNSVIIPVVSSEIGTIGQYMALFASSNSQNYRLIIHIASADTDAWSLKLDDIQVGQPDLIFGMPGSDWRDGSTLFTFSAGFGTVTSPSIFYRRVGDSVQVIGYGVSGAVSSPGYILFPSSMLIDTTKLSTIANASMVGTFTRLTSSGSNTSISSTDGIAFLVYDGASNDRIYAAYRAQTTTFTGDFPLASGDGFAFQFTIPIANWDSSIQLSSSKVEYAFNSDTSDASNLSAFGYGAQGASIGSFTTTERIKRVRFPNPVSQTDHVFVEVNENGNWLRLADHALNPTKQGAVRYGIRATPVAGSTTDYDVFFGDGGAEAGGSYAGAGSAWSGYTALKWRVVKSQNALGIQSDLSGPKYIGSAYKNGAGGWSTSSVSLVAFAAGSSLSTIVEMNPGPGVIDTANSTQPRFTVNSLPAGTYRVIFNTTVDGGTANGSLAIWDGTNLSGYVGFDGTANKVSTLIGYFTYASSGNRTFEVYGANSSNTTTLYSNSSIGPGWNLFFSIEKVSNL